MNYNNFSLECNFPYYKADLKGYVTVTSSMSISVS